MSSSCIVLVIIIFASNDVLSQIINGSNIQCTSERGCDSYDIICDPGSDCFIHCGALTGQTPNNQCHSAKVHCPNGYNCKIYCNGNSACHSIIVHGSSATSLTINSTNLGGDQLRTANITCPINGECTIDCDNGNNQCREATIYAELSTSLNVTCLNTNVNIGNDICTDLTVNCPNIPISGSCIIKGRYLPNGQTSDNLKIYALYGYTSVDITGGYNIQNSYIYCGNNYESSCLILANSASPTCMGTDICDSPIVNTNTTSIPSLSPSSNPSMTPSSDPSSNPSTAPTIDPTQAEEEYKYNYTVIINDTDTSRFDDISTVITLILTNYNVDLEKQEIDKKENSIIVSLSVSSDVEIDGTQIITDGLITEYGDIQVIVTDDNVPRTTIEDINGVNITKDDTALIIVFLIIGILFIVCVVLLIHIYRRQKKIQSMNGIKETQMATSISVNGEGNENDGAVGSNRNLNRVVSLSQSTSPITKMDTPDTIDMDTNVDLPPDNDNEDGDENDIKDGDYPQETGDIDDMYDEPQKEDMITPQYQTPDAKNNVIYTGRTLTDCNQNGGNLLDSNTLKGDVGHIENSHEENEDDLYKPGSATVSTVGVLHDQDV